MFKTFKEVQKMNESVTLADKISEFITRKYKVQHLQALEDAIEIVDIVKRNQNLLESSLFESAAFISSGENGLTIEHLANRMNMLLANYQIFFQSSKGLHWNIKGRQFFELHEKFEELYLDSQERVDQIAERILALGFTPLHAFSDYLKLSMIEEGKNITEERSAIELIVNNLKTIVSIEKEIVKISEGLNDEATATLLIDFIVQQEKKIWQYSSSLK